MPSMRNVNSANCPSCWFDDTPSETMRIGAQSPARLPVIRLPWARSSIFEQWRLKNIPAGVRENFLKRRW